MSEDQSVASTDAGTDDDIADMADAAREDESVASTDAGTDDDIGDVTDAAGEVIVVGAVGACILDVANVEIGAVDAEGAANDEDATEDEDAEGVAKVAEDVFRECYGCRECG